MALDIQPIDYVLFVALAAVFATLCFGVWNLMKTGPAARSTSNKLMRMRVVLQFVAVIVLVVAFYLKRGSF